MRAYRGSRLYLPWMRFVEAFKGGERWCIGCLEDYRLMNKLLYFPGEIPAGVCGLDVNKRGPTALGVVKYTHSSARYQSTTRRRS